MALPFGSLRAVTKRVNKYAFNRYIEVSFPLIVIFAVCALPPLTS